MVTKAIEDRAVDVAYMNFRKAFDKRSISRMAQEIKMHGINGFLKVWIQNWLAHSCEKVLFRVQVSEV